MSELPALASYALMGRGSIGGTFEDVATKPHIAMRHGLQSRPAYVYTKDGWLEGGSNGLPADIPPDELPDVDALFIAMPSLPDNEPMLSFTREQLARDRIVVTAEKATTAAHLTEFFDSPSGKFGFWAAAGGGARIVPVLPYYTIDPHNILELYKGMNGTTADIFSLLAEGYELPEVLADAETKKTFEPPKEGDTVYDSLGTEFEDAGIKEIILAKLTLPGFEDFDHSRIKTVTSPDDIDKAVAETRSRKCVRRYLTAVFPEWAEDQAMEATRGRLGGFDAVRHAGFILIGGLLPIDNNQALQEFHGVKGAHAAFSIHLGPRNGSSEDGYYFVKGDGAGPGPTATAKLDNFEAIRQEISEEAVIRQAERAKVLIEVAWSQHNSAN